MIHETFARPAGSARRRFAVSFATVPFLAFAAALGAQTAAAPRHLRDVLAGDALAYVEAPDFQATLQRGKDIPVVRILREEEFQQFLGPLWQMARAEFEQGLKEIAEKPENWQSCPLKSVELGAGRLTAGQPVGFYAHIETGKLGDVILRRAARPEAKRFANVTTEDGVTLITPTMQPNVAVAIAGDSIVIAFTQPTDQVGALESAKRLIKGLRSGDAKNTLSADAQYQALTSKLQTKNPEWIVYLKPAAIFEELEQTLRGPGAAGSRPATRAGGKGGVEEGLATARAILKELGYLGMKAVAVAESYSPGAVASESFMLLDGEPTGALAFFTGRKPVDKALLDKAYDGVDAFSIHSTEPKLLYDAIYNSVVAVHNTAGDKMDSRFPILQMLADYEKRHNIKIGDDFFGSVGPDCYSYSYPPKAGGGLAFPDAFLALRLRDRAKFEKCLKEFVASAAETKNVKVDVSEASAGRPAVYTLKFELGDNPAMMQAKMLLSQIGLSLAITDEWALFSTNPVALKKELQKLGKPRDVSADVKKYFAEIPANATAFSYHDWKPTIRTLWDLAAGSAALIGGASEDLPVNLQDIPTSQSITKHLTPSRGYTAVTKDGVYSKSVGSFGLETSGSIVLGIAGFAAGRQWMMARGPMPNDDEESGAVTMEAPPPTDATAAARTTLRKIDVAINVFKAEKGKYPESLDILIVANDDHPQGYIVGMKEIPKDPWGTPFYYKRSGDGATYQLRSFGPNTKDDDGSGDDIR